MEKPVKKNFPVTGLSCASCAASVESMLKAQPGVLAATVNFADSTAWVEYRPDLVGKRDLRTVIQSIGYDLMTDKDNSGQLEESEKIRSARLKRNTIWSAVLALPVVTIAMFMMNIPYANWIMMVLSTPVVTWFGRMFFINAYKQARHRKANMDTLVALSTGITYLFSVFSTVYPEFWISRGQHPHVYFETSAVVIAFILLGKLLEERAKTNTSSAIRKLMGLQAKTVSLVTENGEEKVISISQVKVGDQLLVKPGEKIPVDGEVVSGSSYVDESTITGESIPSGKTAGSRVFSGTINQKGSFVFIALRVGEETLLAQIIKMVREAQGSKAPVQRLVDKIAGVFVPIVLFVALATFAVWMIAGGEEAIAKALTASVAVLVVACPCALGLATPTAIMVGIGKGAENGILIKDAESLELAHRVDAIVFDKTGTITEGKPEVTSVIWNVEETAGYKDILYTIETLSEHPLAEAVKTALKTDFPKNLNTEKFESFTGKGVSAVFRDMRYIVGNARLLDDFGVKIPDDFTALSGQWQSEGKTVLFFASETQLLAAIAAGDRVKDSSAKAIRELQDQGIEVYMLTGDNQKTAKSVAHQIKLKNFAAELLPADKAEFVKKLQADGKIVAMAGDGINDSHALAQADVSIAMGKGSDIAIDVAKMTLISSDLQSVSKAIRLSKITVKAIRQNLFWAFIYNAIGIPVAAGLLFPLWGIMLSPMLAGAAMALSSVSVVSNSLRIRAKKL